MTSTNRRLAVDIIRDAWRHGQPIVPFLGAGLSAGAGFPLIADIRDYLCKVRFFIRTGVYRHLLGEPINQPQDPASPQNHPARYLRQFGWPDFNQIDADLWNYVLEAPAGPRSRDESLERKYGDRYRKLRWFFDIFGHNRQPPPRRPGNIITTLEPSQFLQLVIHYVLLDDIAERDQALADRIEQRVYRLDFKPRLDWSNALIDLAEGQLGLIDAFIARLNQRRQPSRSHVLLAHVARLLRMRVLLSINYDTLLETALRAEGLPPTVFELSRDDDLPDPAVVAENLALIKLHGGSHGLRYGERIQYALQPGENALINAYWPPEALMLVVGFSGYERRMMGLVEQFIYSRPPSRRPRVIWMHFEPTSAMVQPLNRFHEELKSAGRAAELHTERVRDVGAFFLELYQQLTATIPRTNLPYGCTDKRLISDTPHPPALDGKQVLVFRRPGSLSDPRWPAVAPSESMSHFADNVTGRDYRLVWIDLEDHHTVAGVVTEILDKLRTFDPSIPPLVQPLNEQEEPGEGPPSTGADRPTMRFRKAVAAIHRALRRGRYHLAFDSLEGFGRPNFAHHGIVSEATAGKRHARRLGDLLEFLEELLLVSPEQHSPVPHMRDLDWVATVAVDYPSPRHHGDGAYADENLQQVNRLLDRVFRWRESGSDSRIDIYDTPLSERGPPATREKPASSAEALARSLADIEAAPNASEHARGLSQLASIADSPSESVPDFMHRAILRVVSGTEEKRIPHTPLHDDASLAAFLVLSCFRRPRTKSSVISVLREFWPPDWEESRAEKRRRLNQILDDLDRHGLMHRMSGNFYWIPHFTHEWVYGALTECVRRRYYRREEDLRAHVGDLSSQAVRKGLMARLVFLATVHSRIARHYYVVSFKRSRDPAAFREYANHRVAALRYLLMLRVVAPRILAEAARSDAASHGQIEREEYTAWLKRMLERDGVRMRKVSADDWIPCIDRVRQKHLQSLVNVLRRDQDVISTAFSADTWLDWIDELLDELRHVIGRLWPRRLIWHLRYMQERNREGFHQSSDAWKEIARAFPERGTDERLQPHAVTTTESLVITLLDLEADLLREKGDMSRLWEHRRSLLERLTSFLSKQGKKHRSKQGEKLSLPHLRLAVQESFDYLSSDLVSPFQPSVDFASAAGELRVASATGNDAQAHVVRLVMRCIRGLCSAGRSMPVVHPASAADRAATKRTKSDAVFEVQRFWITLWLAARRPNDQPFIEA